MPIVATKIEDTVREQLVARAKSLYRDTSKHLRALIMEDLRAAEIEKLNADLQQEVASE